jgi:hypothetical protein
MAKKSNFIKNLLTTASAFAVIAGGASSAYAAGPGDGFSRAVNANSDFGNAAGANGVNYDTGNVSPFGPLGGAGKSSSITGTATTYGAGGQGYWSDTVSANAPANLGGGGGGAQTRNGVSSGWNGGSGVVVIAYPDSFPALTIGGGLTYTQPTRSGYRVYRFTAGSDTITF